MDGIAQVFQIAGKALFIVFFFGFCIFIHEFGHLLAALWRGLRVERFSIGFGKPLWTRRWRNIDFMVSALPFGGYVALPQLDPTEAPHTSDGEPLPVASPVDRIIAALAGPVFNVLFGFVLAVFVWQIGVMGPSPAKSFVVGHVPETYESADGETLPTPEYAAGLHPSDVVVAVNGEGFTNGWAEAVEKIVLAKNARVTLSVERDGMPMQITYTLAGNPRYEGLGFPFMEPLLPTEIAAIIPDTPAEAAGLQAGDIILEVDGTPVINPDMLARHIQHSGGKLVSVKVRRDGQEMLVENIAPSHRMADGEDRYVIGVQMGVAAPDLVRLHPTPWAQFMAVVGRTYRTSKALVDRRNPVKAKHFSSIIGILQMLWVTLTQVGIMAALSFVILISFSLGIINLVPLPVLDGGHIAFAVIELIIRRRIPPKLALYLQYIFAVLIISFVLYVSFYDVRRVGRAIRESHQHALENRSTGVLPAEPETASEAQSAP